MLRHLSESFTRRMLEELLDREGFAGCYDFIYVPTDIVSGACFFYAFVNLVNPQEAVRFKAHFTGLRRWPVPCDKVAAVDWSESIQGLAALIERYRNSPLVHRNTPDTARSAIYRRGARLAFPRPTRAVKAPRLRPGEKKTA